MKTDKKSLVVFSVIFLVSGWFLFASFAQAATFHWIQTAWTDTSVSAATHALNRLDWTWFFSATSTGTSTGNFIQLQTYSNGVN